jgi:elongation factor P hydroxylase
MIVSADIERVFNNGLGSRYNTVLRGGAGEPFYCAPDEWGGAATIWYRADYIRSALHELAHWCVAGRARRRQDDYGYWYEPDGRSGDQQQRFFDVEAHPQSLERLFCEALGTPFDVSVDNLNGACDEAEIHAFRRVVAQTSKSLIAHGLPQRTATLLEALKKLGEAIPAVSCDGCKHL